MEFYLETSNSINLNIYINGVLADADLDGGNYQVFVTITRLSDNVAITTNQLAIRSGVGKYYHTLTTANNSVVGKYKAVWSYEVGGIVNTKTDYYEVVVGYASAQEVKDYYIGELDAVSNDEIYRREKLARRIINQFCNQKFDFQLAATKVVQGNNSDSLALPERLWTLTSVKIGGTDDITSTIELADEYYIQPIINTMIGYYEIKQDIIFESKYFKRGLKYHVKGDWGWQSVPENVRLAATMLIYDYFNDETLLRRHGVYQSAIGDTQYTFNNDLWFTTGNYDVDLLLGSYTKSGVRLI
jgi:hypothetical protein